MSTGISQPARREFLRAGLAVALVPFAGGAHAATALEHLRASDPAARALGYTADAASVDAATRGGAERRCALCRFYTEPGAAWGPCELFPGKAVKATGWCTGWAARG